MTFWKKSPSFFTNVNRENIVKSLITSKLADSIQDIQTECINPEETLISNETTNNLCSALEAVFIHGLKDTFIERMSAIFSDDPDRMPEPNFWPLLLVFLPKGIILQINKLTQITSDIGRCRVWVRIALNDGILDSYLDSIGKDKSSLKFYYKKTAYCRDTEQFEIMKKYVLGTEAYKFQLACNSSLLNFWTSSPLVMAGLWAPPVVPDPVVQGVDVAQAMEQEEKSYQNSPVASHCKYKYKTAENKDDNMQVQLENSGKPIQMGLLNEDEALTVILGVKVRAQTTAAVVEKEAVASETERKQKIQRAADTGPFTASLPQMTEMNERKAVVDSVQHNNAGSNEVCGIQGNRSQADCSQVVSEEKQEALNIDGDKQTADSAAMGNSLIGRVGWSSLYEEQTDTPASSKYTVVTSPTQNEGESYMSLLQRYNPLAGPVIRTLDFSHYLPQFRHHDVENEEASRSRSFPDVYLDSLEFEVIPETSSLLHSERQMLVLLGKLAPEQGLDCQNYRCKECGRQIGMIFGKARVCSFDGCYYCHECHEEEDALIPARILHNWDFHKYRVSKRAHRFLQQIENEAVLDISQINPLLYVVASRMSELLALRTQLNLLRAYLFTCREPVIEELRKRVWPREYLSEHVHLYSVADLVQIHTGVLVQTLKKAVAFACSHIAECWLCSQKGFICEICNNPKIIYPFDLESTYRCPTCCALYHSGCLDGYKPCPRCERRKKHERCTSN